MENNGILQPNRYMNPYTDFGFKILFGTEVNKDLLISFLNALFRRDNIESEITDVTYLSPEQLGSTEAARRAVYDIYCTTKDGGRFIVEMQRGSQEYFKDRSVYYAAFPIRDMGKKGEWDFRLDSVYTVGILNFKMKDYEDKKDEECFHHEVKLMDTEKKTVFYDKLSFIYVEMPKFKKTIEQCVTMFDKWMFVLKNITRLFERPAALQEKVFAKVFEIAEIAQFTPEQQMEYEESLKVLWDYRNTIDFSHKEGKEEGIVIGREEGIAIGREEGIAIGEKRGIAVGREEGIAIGEKRGIAVGREEGIAVGREEGIAIGEKRGIDVGRAEGREEGKAEEKHAMARNLLAMGILTIEQISQATGLTVDEIEKLRC